MTCVHGQLNEAHGFRLADETRRNPRPSLGLVFEALTAPAAPTHKPTVLSKRTTRPRIKPNTLSGAFRLGRTGDRLFAIFRLGRTGDRLIAIFRLGRLGASAAGEQYNKQDQ